MDDATGQLGHDRPKIGDLVSRKNGIRFEPVSHVHADPLGLAWT